MRTKTLLIAAAALVAGIISSNAQTVYSQNIVGYVNVTTITNQLALLCNPLDNGTNTLSSLFPSTTTCPIGSQVQVWNGTGFTGSTKTPTSWSPNLTVVPGQGFFIKMGSTTQNYTNALVGNIIATPGSTVTNAFTNNILQLVGAQIPFQDTLGGTNLNFKLGTGSSIQVWNGTSYSGSTRTPTSWSPNLTINPGQGFFVKELNGPASTNVVETLPGP